MPVDSPPIPVQSGSYQLEFHPVDVGAAEGHNLLPFTVQEKGAAAPAADGENGSSALTPVAVVAIALASIVVFAGLLFTTRQLLRRGRAAPVL
jgi:hypothetical protein